MHQRTIVVCVVVIVTAGAIAPMTAVATPVGPDTPHECSYPLTVTDGTGTEVTVQDPPEDIVVLHASTAQVMQEVGVWDRVSGAPVTPFTAYLDEHDAPHDVTDQMGWPIVEEIIDLDPDLVLVGHVGDENTVETLRNEGLTVYQSPAQTSIDDIATKVDTLGALVDACDGAAATIEWMNAELDAVEEPTDPPIVYYELGDGWTAGDGTFQHDAIERAGGTNLASEAGLSGWAPITGETVILHEPDVIVYSNAFEHPPVSEPLMELEAIQNEQIVTFDPNLFSQAGPLVVEVIVEMASEIEAVADSEGAADDGVTQPGDDTSADDGADDSSTDDTVTTTTDGDDTADAIPGFGAVAALLALLGVCVRIGRR